MAVNPVEIDEHLLAEYMSAFLGFGSYQADFWLVGMEHGGGRDKMELAKRLDAWRSLDSGGVVDFAKYSERIEETKWFGPRARIQKTFGGMIRVLLAAQGVEVSREAVREYQSTKLGRVSGETLVGELLPLASKTVGQWSYGDWSSNPHLRTRKEYREKLLPERRKLLRNRIDRYRPRAVVFFGWSYMDQWEALVGSPLEELRHPTPGARWAHLGKTTYVVCHHPNARGVTNEYFEEIGKVLAPDKSR